MIADNEVNIRESYNRESNAIIRPSSIKETDRNLLAQEDKPEEKKRVSYFKLQYHFADKKDIVIIAFACFGSLVAGAAMPLMALLLGSAINVVGPESNIDSIDSQITSLLTTFILVGFAIFIGSFMMVFFWNLSGKRLINKISTEYFRVILRQEQGWFDRANAFEFATKVQMQTKTIESGVRYIYNKIFLILAWK